MSLALPISDRRDGDFEARVSSEELAPSRWPFAALCLYLTSQAITIPVAAVGPSWALWPTLPDGAAALLVLVCCCPGQTEPFVSRDHRNPFVLLSLAFTGCLLSFLLLGVWLPPEGLEPPEVAHGFFGLFRLGQFLMVFWAAAQIPLSPSRQQVLGWLFGLVLIVVCLGVLATFFNVVPLALLVRHLPEDRVILSPWKDYLAEDARHGWGAGGYHPAYVASQILLLLALVVRFSSHPHSMRNNLFMLLALAASFLSGSRAGFASVALFVLMMLLQRPSIGILLLGALAALGTELKNAEFLEDIVQLKQSQEELLDPTHPDSLNGRAAIWEERFEFLRANQIGRAHV